MMIKLSESRPPVFRATSLLSRGTLKSKGGGQISIHSCADGDTIETFFRTFISVNQLSFCGTVSDLCEEYGSCQTRRFVVTEQSDPHFAPADLSVTTPTPSIEIPAQENLLQKHKRTSGKASTTRLIDKDLFWCRIPENSWCRTVLHDQRHWRILTILRFSGLSWVYFTTRWQINCSERLDSGEHQNWTRIGRHNQLPSGWTRSGNQNWICEQRQFSPVGQNFSWPENIGHRLNRQGVRWQRAGQRAGDVHNEDGGICLCKPIKG